MSALPRPARAHGDDGPASAPVISPRAEAKVGPLQLVAVYKPGTIPTSGLFSGPSSAPTRDTLALFVTRYADGEPAADAQIEAGGDLESVPLQQTDPGVYVTHDLMISPGRNDVRFTIKMPDAEERTQTLSLLVPGGATAAMASAAPVSARVSPTAIGAAVVAVYATMMGAFLLAGGHVRLRRASAALRTLRPLRRRAGIATDPIS